MNLACDVEYPDNGASEGYQRPGDPMADVDVPRFQPPNWPHGVEWVSEAGRWMTYAEWQAHVRGKTVAPAQDEPNGAGLPAWVSMPVPSP